MKRVLSFVGSFLEFLVIIYVILITAMLLCKNDYGYTQFGNYTFCTIDLADERANEGVKAGDLLLVRNSNDIKEGDVIYYYVVFNESYLVQSSPVVHVESDEYSAVYTIEKNDNTLISSNRVLGKDIAVYHHLGTILDVLQSRIGFLLLVLLPIFVIFIYQVYELVIILRFEKVDLEELEKEVEEQQKSKKE